MEESPIPNLIGTALGRFYMHARPQIRDILIQKKLLRWCQIAKWHPIDRAVRQPEPDATTDA
jgi:hypothetical protein